MMRTVQKSIVIAAIALLVVGAAMSFADTVHGSGVTQRQTRTVAAFTRLRVSGSVDVEFSRAKDISVVVEADDNIVPLIDTLVHDGELEIKSHQSYSSSDPARVIVKAPSLQRAQLSGSGSATLDGLSGDRFEAGLSGSGTLQGTGSVGKVNVDLSGSGSASLSQLKASDAAVTLSGSGSVEVNASTSLDASLSGSGDIHCTGSPGQVHQDVTGSGHVRVE